MFLKHVITTALALVPSIGLADSPALRASPFDDGVQLRIEVIRDNADGKIMIANKHLSLSNGVLYSMHEGITLVMSEHDQVDTGLSIAVKAHSASESVVAVHLAFSDSSLKQQEEGQQPKTTSHGFEAGRWLSIKRGHDVSLMIGEDIVRMKAL